MSRPRTGVAVAGVLAAGSLALAGSPPVVSGQGSQLAGAAQVPTSSQGSLRAVTAQVGTLRALSRPNVLVITADDMRADDLRWMPRTRRLLADRGITFRNSFATTPLCGPARSSLLTGRYAHNHGVLHNHSVQGVPYGFSVFDDSSTLGTRLRRTGYRTALVGKYVNGYGSQSTFGAERPSLRYVPPGWTQWWASISHDWRPDQWPGGNTYNYMHQTSNVNGQLRTWPGRYTTGVTAGQTRDLVRRFGRTRSRGPWFIWWAPVAPHTGTPHEQDDPGTIRQSDGVRNTWPTPARPRWVRHRFDQLIAHAPGTPPDRQAEGDVSDKPRYIRTLPPLTALEKRADRDLTRQRAEALYVLDIQISRTLTTLRRSGQASNTIVVFTSDNGYYLGEHRKRQFKLTLHEPSVRVPLIMAGPGIPHGVRYDPATVEDLAVTVAGWARTTLVHADGHSLASTIADGDHGWTVPVVLEALMTQSPYLTGTVDRATMRGMNTSGIRTGRYALIRYSTGETELYDLLRDPLELNSLTGPTHSGLRRLLIQTWRQYAGCSGAQCQVKLPPELRTETAENRSITSHQNQMRHRYYHY